ncbi:uncharacterized protein VTP21DRAFT_4616 [Calcarisporiella thermophila]|uniref:uncharacterized protein n=1 Tax=Calcarisporiella thermophila TaxID=911321 RepID=UPI0037440ED0
MAPVEFSPPTCPFASQPWLASFDFIPFILFICLTVLLPYPLFWSLACYFDWERANKSPSRHFEDVRKALMYGLVVFVFGNYTFAQSWVTFVVFYLMVLGYFLISQVSFTKTSLPTFRTWSTPMWILFLTALGIVLAFAAFHIYLAWTEGGGLFLGLYVAALAVPAVIFVGAILAKIEQNTVGISGPFRRRWHMLRNRRWLQKDSKAQDNAGSPQSQAQADASEQAQSQGGGEALVFESQHPSVGIHLHHWQIFYTLAFFTRFDSPVSQIGAGLVLACYMEGIIAYGYDSLLL